MITTSTLKTVCSYCGKDCTYHYYEVDGEILCPKCYAKRGGDRGCV